MRTKVQGDTCAQVATSWEGMHGQKTSGGLEPKGHSWWPGKCSAFPPLLIKAESALLDVCTLGRQREPLNKEGGGWRKGPAWAVVMVVP